ncbi:MAG: GntR family transcriptional regulator [Gordonia sp. (in: high G+C Gram-positive bacteria)]|uniref:GntR family transcriptional regulator n=1 Tax=Gordonia sp. (in: high G+C Gram-positive bacteria) TaxID=84139 RepID=UPI0039E5038B
MRHQVNLPSSLQQVAADEIRRRIFARELAPGARIEQESLAEEIGMSKIPVREAISALVTEGLVEMFPRRGAFVVEMTKQDIEDHYWMLAHISAHAAARAAETIADETLDRLDENIAAMEAATDEAERSRLSTGFHATVNQAAGSRRMNSVLRMLGSPVPLDFYETRTECHAEQDHRAILDALRARDPERTRAAMENHFIVGAVAAIKALEDAGFWETTETPAGNRQSRRR